MNAVAYIRKSTSGKDDSGCERQEGSFDRQKASIEDFARHRDLKIIRWYEEPVSGKSIRKRKIFLQMVKDAKNPTRLFNAIIFEDFSRFMRDVKESKRYEVELDDAGIKLLFTNFQNDDSMAAEMYKGGVRAMSAEYSRELARKVLQGMIRQARKGCWLGGVAPFGYRTCKDAEGNTWLVIYEPEAITVRKIYDLSYKGWGHKKIARWLNEQGILASEAARKRNSTLNKNLDGKWSGDTVRHLLRNPVYKGVVRWNKRARVDCFDWTTEGKGTVEIKKLRTENEQFRKSGDRFDQRSQQKFFIDRAKAEKEWIKVEGKAPAIVAPETFDAVQERFKKYATDKCLKANTARSLMTGALICTVCGGNRYQAHRTTKIIKSTGERASYYFYRCSGDVRKASHVGLPNNLIIKQSAIDSVVEEGLHVRIQHLARPGKVTEMFEEKLRVFLGSNPNRLAEVETELKEVRAEQDRLIYAYGKFEQAIPEDKVQELKERLRSLETQRDDLIAAGHERTQREDVKLVARRFLKRIGEARKSVVMGDPQERIHIRQAFLPKAEVSWYNQKPKIQMFWRRFPEFAGCDIRSTSICPYIKNESRNGGVLISLKSHRNQGTSTHSSANWLFDKEEFEVESYIYKDSQLILVKDGPEGSTV